MTQLTEKEIIERILENMKIARDCACKLQELDATDPMWNSLTQGLASLYRTVNTEVSRKALSKDQTSAHIAARAIN